ncbi:MAG: hypothetical protein ACHQQQ_11625 [Bacteroidota bacterium]
MSTHYVKFSIPKPNRDVGNADFKFEVYAEKVELGSRNRKPSKLGTLKISKGKMEWASSVTKRRHHVTWEGFAEYAEKGRSRRANKS